MWQEGREIKGEYEARTRSPCTRAYFSFAFPVKWACLSSIWFPDTSEKRELLPGHYPSVQKPDSLKFNY